MTLTIDLSPTEEALIAAVVQNTGLSPAEAARKLLTQNLLSIPNTVPQKMEDPSLALFAQWEAEDAQMTPEEATKEQRLWEQFEQNVNETRDTLGMRHL